MIWFKVLLTVLFAMKMGIELTKYKEGDGEFKVVSNQVISGTIIYGIWSWL